MPALSQRWTKDMDLTNLRVIYKDGIAVYEGTTRDITGATQTPGGAGTAAGAEDGRGQPSTPAASRTTLTTPSA